MDNSSRGQSASATSSAKAWDVRREEVLEIEDLVDIVTQCKKLGISARGLKTVQDGRERIIQYWKSVLGELNVEAPINAVSKAAFEEFAARRVSCQGLIQKVRNFVGGKEVEKSLEKLQFSTMDFWLNSRDIRGLEESLDHQLVILVGGSTSSGKSTFLNAILGVDILPASHNAATSALCEIKYGETRSAILHYQDGEKESLALDSSEDRSKFEDVVNIKRESHEPDETSEMVSCAKVEVFLPIEFLKRVILVDSPGVTEREEDCRSMLRQMTETCQRDVACGFIYVLDATRAAEEAAQAGGLLRNLVATVKHPLPPETAVFIANKWDQLENSTDEFMTRTSGLIREKWPGFQSQQLLTMNSKLAASAQSIGLTTADMENVIIAMKSMLSAGMHHKLSKVLSPLYELMDRIEQILQSGLRELRLPFEELQRKRKEDWGIFDSTSTTLKSEKMSEAKRDLETRVDDLVKDLTEFLMSKEGKKCACEPRGTFNKMDVQNVVVQRIVEVVSRCPKFQTVLEWSNTELKAEVDEVRKKLNMVKADVAAASNVHSYSGLYESIVRRAASMTVVRTLLAIAIAAVVGVTVVLIRKRPRVFQVAVETAYRKAVENLLSNHAELLKKAVMDILSETSPPVKALLHEIPKQIENISKELNARHQQNVKDRPYYDKILKECQAIKGEMAKFLLELDIHLYSENALSWPEPRTPVASGNFGTVYKVTLPTKQEAALKQMIKPLTVETSEPFLKEINISRYFTHDNVVKFLGTVVVSNPRRLGILFEWCDGGTLAAIISDPDLTPPSQAEGFSEGRRIACEILSGVKYLHSHGIVHRDLKPENVMMTSKREVRLGDLGLAKPMKQVQGTVCGTLMYMAPEVFKGHPYGLSADVYSVGIMLWEIWNAKRVYSVVNVNVSFPEFAERVANGEMLPNKSKFAGEDDRDKLLQERAERWGNTARNCWSLQARKRMLAEEIV
jgi:receptor-interacting serine/threonine-protein kinase 5